MTRLDNALLLAAFTVGVFVLGLLVGLLVGPMAEANWT